MVICAVSRLRLRAGSTRVAFYSANSETKGALSRSNRLSIRMRVSRACPTLLMDDRKQPSAQPAALPPSVVVLLLARNVGYEARFQGRLMTCRAPGSGCSMVAWRTGRSQPRSSAGDFEIGSGCSGTDGWSESESATVTSDCARCGEHFVQHVEEYNA